MPSALVILTEELPVHPRELAPDLAPLLGMVTYDVISAFNRSRVLPFEKLDDQRAAAAVECLEKHGVPAAAVPAERLPPAPKVFTVHNADVEADGLNVQVDLVGRMRKLAWDEIAALSAARISQSRSMTGMTGPSTAQRIGRAASIRMGFGLMRVGGGAGMRGRKRAPMKQRVESCAVIALAPREASAEIRFHSNAFNYDYLGERLVSSVEQNFRTFAADLVERAGGALVSPGLRALAGEGAAPPKMATDAFKSYNRWLRLRAEEGL